MIKLIVGTKGAGKTKTIVSMANAAGESSNGNVVFVEKGMKLQYDLATSVRLVDTEEYDIVGSPHRKIQRGNYFHRFLRCF